MVNPRFERIHATIKAARVLEELIGSLLPRFISGKLRLHQAQPQEAIA